MLTQQKAAGDQQMADINVKMAMDVLTHQLPVYGPTSEKGRALMKMLSELGKVFAMQASEAAPAVPSEISSLVSSLKGTPGAPPASPIAGGSPLPTPPQPGA